MSQKPWGSGDTAPRLKIGEAATLTGVTPGRIRHYQKLGLLRPTQADSGYRYFNAADLVKILQIDLLRSLGMGLDEIANSLPGEESSGSLKQALERHRATLVAEHERLGALLAAVERALMAPEASAESIAAYLASAYSTPRDSLGIFGRLTRPLSADAASSWAKILGAGFDLPVPAIFGRMLLPPQVTEVLERLAEAPGNEVLFERVRALAADILALSGGPSTARSSPRELAAAWIDSFRADRLPPAVESALDATFPRIRELGVLNQGFQLWAESISPTAGQVLRLIQDEARQRHLVVLGVLPAHPRP